MDPRDELNAYLDDELSDGARAELDEAMASDPALRAELAELEEVAQGLRSFGPVEAPPNFLAGVMARVDAGEGLGEPLFPDEDEDEDEDALAPTPGLSVVESGDAEPDLPDNVIRVPWWVKGPALTAVAALLIVGISLQIRGDKLGEPPSATSVAMRPASDAAPPSPIPTGAVTDDTDALASLDVEEVPVAERLRMNGPAGDTVAVGGAGSAATLRAPAPTPKPTSTGLREVAEPPTGIVMGNFDRVALGYSPEPAPEAEEADAVADAEASELMPADPAGSLAVAPAAPDAAAGERAAMAAIAQLTTSDSSAIMQIRDGAEAQGWSIHFVSPRDGPIVLSDALTEQVLELSFPAGAEPAAQAMLESRGTFSFSSTPAASAESNLSRLRVTIIYRP